MGFEDPVNQQTINSSGLSSLLRGTTHTAYVSYTFRPMEVLRRECDWISDVYDGRSWSRRLACQDIDMRDGDREFLVATLPKPLLGKWMDKYQDELEAYVDELGYRFAIEVEALSFARAHPALLCEGYLLALGSVTSTNTNSCHCACLWEADGRRYFGERTLAIHFSDQDRLLLVRK